MFSTVRMSLVEAVVLRKRARAALLAIGPEAEIAAQAGVRRAAPQPGPERGAALSARAAAVRASLGLPARGGALPDRGMTFERASSALAGLEEAAAAAAGRREAAAARLSAIAAELKKASPYAGLPLPSDGLRSFRFLYCAAGRLPAGNLAALSGRLPRGALLLALGEEEGSAGALALGRAPDSASIASALARAGFRPESPPSRPGLTLRRLAAVLLEEKTAAEAGLALAEKELREAAARAAGPLEAIESAAALETALAEAEGGIELSDRSAVIKAWVPSEKAAALAAKLSEGESRRCAAAEAAPPEGTEPPVLMRQPAALRPFLRLVSGYGLPRYGEVDPTLFAALAYLLMFGMMFGDAGHGLALCAAGLALALKARGAGLADAGKIIFACGVSACLFGLVYGSFFGLEGFKSHALWRDPLGGDPVSLLKAAVAAGAAVISCGVALNIVNRARAGDLAGALLDRFGAAGLLFYWSGLAAAAGFLGARPALALAGLAFCCWAARGPALYLLRRAAGAPPGEDGLGLIFAESLTVAFEGGILYLANTVSFVRLAAYAISHAALVAAAGELAGAADRAWGPGGWAGPAAAAAGNAAAIGLEGLIAGVQAMRLEYYEFFGKFFSGGGRAFRPLLPGKAGG